MLKREYICKRFAPLLLTSIIIGSIGFGGCGKKKETHIPQEDSISVDTISDDTIATPEDTTRTYFSDDLKSFGIRGDVLQRSAMRHGAEMVYPVPTMELTFDSVGNFTGSLQGLYAKQNDEGINYSYSMNYEDGTSWELNYTEWNEHNFPVKAEILESGPQGVAKAEITYYGYEYDREGNWVMRSVSMGREFTETETEEKSNTFRKWKELVSYKYRENPESETRK